MATAENLVRWRNEFRQVHKIIEKDREEFEAWFEETALLEAEIKIETEELRQTVTDIKNDRQQYSELLKQIPNVDDFSDEEVEKRSGKASALLHIAGEIAIMKIHVPRKVEKLRFLLKHSVSITHAPNVTMRSLSAASMKRELRYVSRSMTSPRVQA
jgi:septal ring factor EnvC (AmiA/AmiB activator)